ncbi:hypothetical protein [Nocardia farcinica]|uniref:hypothetical protein n=1 Tax=Nocardia farcinica TaxID=37329 RepID=UPI00189461DF|nr:hypothetical protein [Nocardia farcinica]MBF6251573.1 hypothetical protein [Nocardia farcinica]
MLSSAASVAVDDGAPAAGFSAAVAPAALGAPPGADPPGRGAPWPRSEGSVPVGAGERRPNGWKASEGWLGRRVGRLGTADVPVLA